MNGNSVDRRTETVFTQGVTRTDISHRPFPTRQQAKGNPLLVTLVRAAEVAKRQQMTLFVYPTFNRWNISTEAPACGSFYELDADGERRWKVEA